MFLDPVPLPKDGAFLRQSPQSSESAPLFPVDPMRKKIVGAKSLVVQRTEVRFVHISGKKKDSLYVLSLSSIIL